VNVQPIEDIKEKIEGVKEYVVFVIAVFTVISFVGKRVGNNESEVSENSDTTSNQKDVPK